MTWYLVQIYCWNKPYWVRKLNDNYWENRCGSHVPRQSSDILLAAVEEKNYEDLDHTKTGLVVERSNAGWLSRTGRWYPCEVYAHQTYAELIIKTNYYDLMNRGWVRVHSKKEWFCKELLSSEQHVWLLQHKYKVEECDI